MRTLILGKAVVLLLPFFVLFSVDIFFRGHNLPGGGFIAALIAATGFILHLMSFGVHETVKRYRINSFALIGSGLLASFTAAVLPLLIGHQFFEGLWLPFEIPLLGTLGTPTLFDLGVYLLVVGIVLKIAFNLFEEEESWK